jgi:hypothetical protein
VPKLVRGEKRAFIRKHLAKSNDEIAAIAPAAYKLTRHKIQVHRHAIKKADERGGPARKFETAKARIAARERPTARSPESNGHVHPKDALLRRIIFEMGYDAARLIWDEFERAHRGMQSRDGDGS